MTTRTCGAYCRPQDALLVVGAALFAWLGFPLFGRWALAPAVVAVHFFLFCNVFRIHRYSEYLWSAAFVANVAFWARQPSLNWLGILAVQLPLTAAVVLYEATRPRYHGIGARTINAKHVDRWLAGEDFQRGFR